MNAPFTPEQIEAAAQATADPSATFREALERLPSDPGALFDADVLDALRTIRRKDEAEFIRLTAAARGQRTRLERLTRSDSCDSNRGGDNLQNIAVSIARQHATFAHTEDGKGVAIIDAGTHREVHLLDSPGFQRWLRGQVYAAKKEGVPELTLRTVLATLTAIGEFEGECVALHTRCAKHGGGYYIDLCNDAWQALRIDAEGFEVMDRPPVYFIRTPGMRALPSLAGAGNVNRLWEHVNIPETSRLLVLAWLLDSLRPDTPYPVLELSGEMGSSKSTTQARLRALIDPHDVPLRAHPKTIEDIHIAAANAHVVSFENLSHLNAEHQDALCILSTGGGYATRQLYTNGGEHVSRSKCPVLLNGINPVATQPDLIERAVSVELPTIHAAARRDEQNLESAWQRDYPTIFVGLVSLFSEALALLPTVKIPGDMQKRMLDFQRLGEAVSIAMGGSPGEFSKELDSLHGESIIRGLESFGIAAAIQVLIANRPAPRRTEKRMASFAVLLWSGTFLQLLQDLNSLPEIDRSNWPRSPRHLSAQLKRIAPGLRLLGIRIERKGHARSGAIVELKGDPSDS